MVPDSLETCVRVHCRSVGIRELIVCSVRRILLGVAIVVFAPAFADAADSASQEIIEERLAPRSGPIGLTLFSELPPGQTGIVTENNYNDPSMWAQRYAEFATGAVGTGVAFGDYDNDGRPDVFVVSKTESCRLFRNLGEWKFEDVTERAGVGDTGDVAFIWKQGVTFVDVNNDGQLDIHVCRFAAPNLLYVNQGDGTFREEAVARGLAVVDGSVMAGFHDFDRDGWLDVFVQTNWPESNVARHEQRNLLFRNNGDGVFTDVTEAAGISGKAQGHSAIWWDYDNDGWPDIYVANDFTPPDQLFRNNRDGSFTNVINEVVPHMPFSSMGADLGDVNNDGLIDLLVADMAATTHEKDQRTMANARSLIVDPVDGAARFAMRNALYLNTGTGRMLEAAFLTGLDATDWTWSVRFEDLDNDGRLDLHATNGMYREPHNADLMVRIAGAETLTDKVRMEKASPVLREENLAFRNRGDLLFEEVGAAWGLNETGVSIGAAFGDLDGDGDLDLIYTNYKQGVTVLRNDSDAGHRVIIALRGSQSNRFGVGASVQIETASGLQVRPLVLARGVLSSSEPVLHFGLGGDELIDRLMVTWPGGIEQSFVGLAADRKYTITETTGPIMTPGEMPSRAITRFTEVGSEMMPPHVVRRHPGGEPDRQPLVPFRHDRRGPTLAVGDFNTDGHADLVIGGSSGSSAQILFSGSGRSFVAADSLEFPTDEVLSDGPFLVFDANGDGADDLLLTKAGSGRPAGAAEYQPSLFLGDGLGGLRPAEVGSLPLLPVSAGAVAAADFNLDGKPDVFVGGRLLPGRYPFAPRSGLLVNRGGRFEDVTDTIAPDLREPGMVTAALWSDVDGDGWPDLVVALEWGGIEYFHNSGGGGFENWSERSGFASAGTGWWTALASADFNRDGRPDFVAGNVGLNTPYGADAAHPALLFAGDFGNDGNLSLLEGHFEGERLFPRRSRRDLGAALPEILRRFQRNDRYARAELAEIVGEEKLAAANQFAVTELRSGVFMSRSDGTHQFEPLPRIVQIAPLQSVVVDDFDHDGFADILAVQNSAAPIPSVGAFDGGLSQFLCGDGEGRFTAVPPEKSGLIVRGFAADVEVLDLERDGWTDVIVTRFDESTQVFRNAGAPDLSVAPR